MDKSQDKIYFDKLGDECFDNLKLLNPKGGIKQFIRMAVEFGYKKANNNTTNNNTIYNNGFINGFVLGLIIAFGSSVIGYFIGNLFF